MLRPPRRRRRKSGRSRAALRSERKEDKGGEREGDGNCAKVRRWEEDKTKTVRDGWRARVAKTLGSQVIIKCNQYFTYFSRSAEGELSSAYHVTARCRVFVREKTRDIFLANYFDNDEYYAWNITSYFAHFLSETIIITITYLVIVEKLFSNDIKIHVVKNENS